MDSLDEEIQEYMKQIASCSVKMHLLEEQINICDQEMVNLTKKKRLPKKKKKLLLYGLLIVNMMLLYGAKKYQLPLNPILWLGVIDGGATIIKTIVDIKENIAYQKRQRSAEERKNTLLKEQAHMKEQQQELRQEKERYRQKLLQVKALKREKCGLPLEHPIIHKKGKVLQRTLERK